MPNLTGMHFLIKGKVQGVFFRRFTEQQAQQLGLTGWVRNLPDGGVEAKAFGSKEQLQQLIILLWQGPPASSVIEVISEEIPLEAHQKFSVK